MYIYSARFSSDRCLCRYKINSAQRIKIQPIYFLTFELNPRVCRHCVRNRIIRQSFEYHFHNNTFWKNENILKINLTGTLLCFYWCEADHDAPCCIVIGQKYGVVFVANLISMYYLPTTALMHKTQNHYQSLSLSKQSCLVLLVVIQLTVKHDVKLTNYFNYLLTGVLKFLSYLFEKIVIKCTNILDFVYWVLVFF